MCYASEDKPIIIQWANSTRFNIDDDSKEEHAELVNRMKSRINLELLKKLDTDNLIDYSQYEK